MSNMLFFFECNSLEASNVFAALAPHMSIIKNFRVETEMEVVKKTRARKSPTHQAPELSAADAVRRIHSLIQSGRSKVYKAIIEILTDNKALTSTEIGKKLVPYGFKENSASPALSYMKRAGVVTHVGREFSLVLRETA